MDTQSTNDFGTWLYRVMGTTRSLTREQQLEVAGVCIQAADNDGVGVGVWHAASLVLNTLDSCPCYPCEQKRKSPGPRYGLI